MNVYLIIILAILIGEYILDFIVERLNINSASGELPIEFKEYYDAQRYKKSQDYLKETTQFALAKNALISAVLIVFILKGGFNYVDLIARGIAQNEIISGLLFAGILMLAMQIISIPFSAYRTFVIEEKYGFNRSTVKTFIADLFKGIILGAIIGGFVFALIVWFFAAAGQWAWVFCWWAVFIFQLFLLFIAPVAILPLFNKFIPLEEGELRTKIEDFVKNQDFKIKGIFKIDASRRSTKSNAYFTGLGKFKRIVLFDTLIERHSVSELVSVLAHEIGHYKKKHILKQLAVSFLTSGFMFFILSLFVKNPGLFSAFKMQYLSVYASIFFFAFLYAPMSLIFSLVTNAISRKHEYEADDFVVKSYGDPSAFIESLKKLSVDNLSNLTPHPLKIAFDYTHPPILTRIEVIRSKLK